MTKPPEEMTDDELRTEMYRLQKKYDDIDIVSIRLGAADDIEWQMTQIEREMRKRKDVPQK